MGEIVYGIDFTARKESERANQLRFEHEVAREAFEGSPHEPFPISTDGGPVVVEPPADCPA